MHAEAHDLETSLELPVTSHTPDLDDLVRRHVDMVYSAALRRVGDRHLAEDVTQAVFVILARKIKSIRDERATGAWLLQTTKYCAANALRIEARRRKREQAAARTAMAGACSSNPTDVLLWQEVAQRLDDAVLKLPALDRQAVVLRYFENKPLAEIAAVLNVTAAAAQRRLSRAIERLRTKLSRGSTMAGIDATSLATLLAAHAVHTAPPGVMYAACVAASTAGGASAAGITIAKGAMHMMAWTKAKIAAAVVAASVIGGAGGVITVHHALAQARVPVAAPQRQAAPVKERAPKNGPSLESAPPVVVKSIPESGADDVDASLTEIKVTYSKAMTDESWSWSTWGQENMPKTTGKPHYEADKKTCVLPVKLAPGKFYAIWLNSSSFHGFADASGNTAVPYLLVFETKK